MKQRADCGVVSAVGVIARVLGVVGLLGASAMAFAEGPPQVLPSLASVPVGATESATVTAAVERPARSRADEPEPAPVAPQPSLIAPTPTLIALPPTQGVAPELQLKPSQMRPSILPIPPAPPEPAPPTKFSVPASDPAGVAARSIARRVAHFKNFRGESPGAVWSVDEAARFSIRRSTDCLAQLERLHVPARYVERELTTPVPTPVAITGPVQGVSFYPLQLDREVEVSCELALRLPAMARILREHGVTQVGVNSSYRDQPKVSFHTFGFALDIAALRTPRGTLSVSKHFEVTPNHETCKATPLTEEGRELLAIVCALAESHLLHTVITPNYNEGHRDHLHLDIRPDDPRLFVR